MRRNSLTSWMRKGLVGTAVLAAALLVSPPADARPKHDKHNHGRHGHRGHGQVHYVRSYHPHRHPVFVPPRHIHVHSQYEPYVYGRVYFAPHHHYHVVYNFPVYVDDEFVYEPYAYCGDDLYATGRVEVFGPRFGLHIGF